MNGSESGNVTGRATGIGPGEALGSLFQLGHWVVDADTCTLSVDSQAGDPEQSVKVTPRSMEVLVYLANNCDRVVSSQELLDELWTSITSDHAVHKAIAELRSAVNDSGSQRSFIVTVPKRGYKLNVAPESCTQSPEQAGANADNSLINLLAKSTRSRLAAMTGVAFVCLAIIVWSTNLVSDRSNTAVLVGVLPFQADSGNQGGNRIVADGLTNSLLSGLSKLSQLGIVSLPHDSRFSTISRSASEIGEELGIDHILEGSLLEVGGQVRVNVRLVRVSDGVQLYSDQFDMTEQNIFSIQDSIVSHITDSLSIHLDEQERRNMLDWGTTNAIAYRHFMEGEFYNNQFNPGDFELAIDHHSEAIRLDPEFENAYLGLAAAANNLAVYSRMDKVAQLQELVASTHRRIATLDRTSPVLESIQAIQARMTGVNHLEQEVMIREQILSGSPPDYALAHYALFLIGARLFEEAQSYLALASEVDPFEISPDEIWSYRADIATPEEELQIRKRQLQERPNHIGLLGTVGRNLVLEGNTDEARAYIQRLEALDTEGVSAHLTAIVVGVLTGELQADSESLAAEYNRGPDFNFSNGVLAFMLNDFEKGQEFWRDLKPVQKRRLRNLVYAVEKFFPASLLESICYQNLLEELGVGISWQQQLMRGVLEMETVTGIALSLPAREALSRGEFMSRNNLWPESVWQQINARLPADTQP